MRLFLVCVMAGALLLTASVLSPIGKSQADENNKKQQPIPQQAVINTEVTPVTPVATDTAKTGKENQVKQYVTRGELAEKLVQSLNLNLDNFRFLKPPAVTELFDDVQTEASYADDVMILVYNQVVNSSERIFRPSEPVLREELAQIIGNLLRHHAEEGLVESVDEPVVKDLAKANAKAAEDIKLAVAMNIMKLNQDGNFLPKQGVTPRELQNILKEMENQLGVNDTGVTAQIITNQDGGREVEISWGEKPSSGYKIFIVDLELDKDTLIIKYTTEEPTPGSYNSTVITEPKDNKPIPESYPAQLNLQLVEV
ncbi:S-layer homology domain-containing protein [Desulforamulus ferrireducens]|uniref:SLH domain-containing protein n=1 Tax=Desulforamulus ferrireducens TaxID=1833852 RepID=A0A1S6IXP8_9FIRM|nr:S-layer homology domain-containing protein [Desulforamulus ferrireducens]AQS59545.1 hypothetical protein B0537_10920 [Desulforamulus ferrireducens]